MSQPTILSDFSARPLVIDMYEPLENLRVFDIGCGEGYVSRLLVEFDPKGKFSINEKLLFMSKPAIVSIDFIVFKNRVYRRSMY